MLRKLGLLLFLCIGASCSTDAVNDSDFVAGDSFTDSNLRVMVLDTSTVLTSTMKFDSIVTSGASRMLVGKYNDPVFGTVEASSYIELLPETYSIDSEAVYDSIVFLLKYDGYYYNDTLRTNSVYFKELSEKLEPEEDDFYNTSSVEMYDTDLGHRSYIPRPLGTDSLEVRMSDSLGLEIFDKLQQQEITNSDEFRDFFKGLNISYGPEDDGSVIGFSLDESVVRLYFSEAEESEQVQYNIDLYINTTSTPTPFFNRITAENPIDYLSSFENQEDNLYSTESDNQSYIQAGIGIATRIEFPHLETIHDIPGEGTLLGAVLRLKPAAGSYNDNLILRDTLSVYLVDQNNDITAQLTGGVSTVQAILNRTNQEFNDIYYEIPLSSYIESLLTAERDTDEALILLPNNYSASVDRFVLNDSNNPDYNTTLEITYAIYDEDE